MQRSLIRKEVRMAEKVAVGLRAGGLGDAPKYGGGPRVPCEEQEQKHGRLAPEAA